MTVLGDRADGAAPRLHWIDWLRVAAIAGVFVFHTLRPFNADYWHVKNAETSAALSAVTTFFSSFGLAVLFLLAGAGVRFALRRRTWQAFIRERLARLIVPFVVGTLVLSSLQGFIEATHHGRYSGSFVDYLGVFAGQVAESLGRAPSPTMFGIGFHLWFLGFLFAISLVALPACAWLTGDRGRALIAAGASRVGWRGATLLFIVPIYLLMGLGSALGTREHDWFEFLWYLGYFLIGFVIVSDDRYLAAVRRDLWPAAGAALLATGLVFAGIPAPLDTLGDQGVGATELAFGALFATMGWAWTLVMLNVGMRAGPLQRPVDARVGDAVLPVYVIHQPVIVVAAFVVVGWPLGLPAKWLVVLTVSAAVTLALVALALRAPLVRPLLGVRARLAQPVASVAATGNVGSPSGPAAPAGALHGRPG